MAASKTAPKPPPPFVHYLDEIDGTLCLPAHSNATDIATRTCQHPLRFPLLLDPTATIEAQIAASTHAPASSRFGPYCDNILGMNWELPNGQVFRIGERVVKTTTGYDWLRFLLHSGRRFGRPLDYVIRLRPDCGSTSHFLMHGPPSDIQAAAARVLSDSWAHWLDAVDVLINGNASHTLRVTAHAPETEQFLFQEHLARVANEAKLQFNAIPQTSLPMDGLPDAVFKTTPDRVAMLAAELVRSFAGLRCVGLCYCGVVHAYLPTMDAEPSRCLQELAAPHLWQLHELGGDWHSRHLPPPEPSTAETAWIATLEEVIRGN
jgi:hypothetical protein